MTIAVMNDEQLLAQIPDFISFDMLMKATPVQEGRARIIYVEASKETKDQQGEVVLQKALQESVGIFKKFGVIDLDHKSMPSVAATMGISNPNEWIIGQPLDVTFKDGVTIVKAQLRQGDTKLAERANEVWEGMTKLNPPDRYYASVGGAVMGRDLKFDPETKQKVPVITKTHWNNLALSLNPVNPHLKPASTTPVGVFAKSLGGFVLNKALEAGYGTDMAGLTGGAALGMQSLDTGVSSYFDFRERMSQAMSSGKCGKNPGIRDLVTCATKMFGLSRDEAAEYVERFVRDLKNGLKRRK